MQSISKGPEPDCLADLRRDLHRVCRQSAQPASASDWDPKSCAAPMRGALCHEQGYLCAYCLQRIKPHGYRSELHNRGGMKIEHWLDRSTHPEQMYDWNNLLGVCGWEFRQAGRLVQHCDTARGNAPLHVQPASASPPRPERWFDFVRLRPDHYAGDELRGVWIMPDPSLSGEDAEQAQSDIDRLNLNADHLVRSRRKAIEAVQARLSKVRGSASRQTLERQLAGATTPSTSGLPPFAPLIAGYLRKRLQATNAPR